jgi:TRAP-type C4-dicarboxylate transport system substrate-binding protein
MGGTPVSMSTSDMVEAISRGQLDCIMGPLAWLGSYPIADLTKYIYNFDIGAFNSVGVMLMNRDVWEKLSPDEKKAVWEAMPGSDARTTLSGYMGEFLGAIELAKKNHITITGPSAETRALATKHRESEIKKVVEEAKKIGDKDPKKIVDAYVRNLAKWEKIIKDAGLDKVVPSKDLTEADIKRALPIYTDLLRKHIYDKVDYSKL